MILFTLWFVNRLEFEVGHIKKGKYTPLKYLVLPHNIICNCFFLSFLIDFVGISKVTKGKTCSLRIVLVIIFILMYNCMQLLQWNIWFLFSFLDNSSRMGWFVLRQSHVIFKQKAFILEYLFLQISQILMF